MLRNASWVRHDFLSLEVEIGCCKRQQIHEIKTKHANGQFGIVSRPVGRQEVAEGEEAGLDWPCRNRAQKGVLEKGLRFVASCK